jgi:hypothetical protein
MADLAKTITGLARTAKKTDDTMSTSLQNAIGVEDMSIDKMTDMYMNMRFEERYEMAIEMLGEQGIDGLKTMKKVMNTAARKWNGR